MKYAWIKEHTKSFNITLMCKICQVNRSAYYHWLINGCVTNRVDTKLNCLIKDIFYKYREVCSTRRSKRVLAQKYGVIVSARKIANTMRQLNLVVKMKRKFRVSTTNSNHNYHISPNRLQRDSKPMYQTKYLLEI